MNDEDEIAYRVLRTDRQEAARNRVWSSSGCAGFIEYMDFIAAAFPDFTNHVEEIIAEGDRAFARLTYRGTHRGAVFGIAPTGRRVEYAGAAVFRFRDGKIAEVWVLGDVHGLLQQLRAPGG